MMRRLAVALVVVGTFAGIAHSATIPGFRSPTRNITCVFIPGRPATMLCTIGQADYAKTLQKRCLGPNGAGVDWHGFVLPAATMGLVSCSGGALYTQQPHYVTLAYGKTWRRKMFSCTSRVDGVNCSNAHGHGMFISRETWRTW
jgi:hypothetical protein